MKKERKTYHPSSEQNKKSSQKVGESPSLVEGNFGEEDDPEPLEEHEGVGAFN